MKNKNIITLLFVCLQFPFCTAMAQSASLKMHDLLTAFSESGEHHVKPVEHYVKHVNESNFNEADKDYRRTFYFSEVWTTDLSQVSDPVKLFPPHLTAFFKGFSNFADEALELYCHDAKENDPMVPGFMINWSGNEQNWMTSITHPIMPKENIRLILFEEPNNQRRLFIMTWEQDVVYDSLINTDQIVTHGQIAEYYGYKPKNAPFVAPHQPKHDNSLPEMSVQQAQTYDELIAKVKRTCEIFKHEGWNGQNAAAVVLHRLSSDYSEKLTKKQYDELINCVQPLIDETEQKGLQQLLAFTCYTFYQKSEHFQLNESIPKQGYANTATISVSQKTKMVHFNTLMMNPGKPVTLKVKGTAPIDAKTVELTRYAQHESLGEYPVKKGHFEFTLTLPKDEMMHLYTSGCNPKKQVFFCADGKELNINLTKGTVTGSKQNQLLTDSLPRFMKLKKDWQIDSMLQMINNNRDNLISAYAIHQIYSELPVEVLRSYLNNDYAYSHHPLLVPIRKYVEGWEKRSLGKPCPDAELLDEKNVLHQLREYTVGKPVLLHFWDNNIFSANQIEQLCRLHEQYPDLHFVSIAINQYPKLWRENIEKYKMNWTNLLAPNGWDHPIIQSFGLCSLPELVLVGVDGFIVDAPTNIEELEQILKDQFN